MYKKGYRNPWYAIPNFFVACSAIIHFTVVIDKQILGTCLYMAWRQSNVENNVNQSSDFYGPTSYRNST